MFFSDTHTANARWICDSWDIYTFSSNHYLGQTNYFRHVQATDSVIVLSRKETVSRDTDRKTPNAINRCRAEIIIFAVECLYSISEDNRFSKWLKIYIIWGEVIQLLRGTEKRNVPHYYEEIILWVSVRLLPKNLRSWKPLWDVHRELCL